MAEKRRRFNVGEAIARLDNLPSDFEESDDDVLDNNELPADVMSVDENFLDPDTQVIQGLITSTDRSVILPTPIPKPFIHHKSADLSRLSGQHFMDVIPATASRMIPMKKCVVYRKRVTRKETRYQCKTCMSRPGLCVVPCFEVFHTETDF